MLPLPISLRRAPRMVAGAAALLLASACDTITGRDPLTNCPTDFLTFVTPTTATLAVGDSVQLRGDARTCGGATPVTATFGWTAADSTVVRVQPQSGWVVARRAGTSTIRMLADAQNGASGVALATVTVRP